MASRKSVAKKRQPRARSRVVKKKRLLFLPWPATLFLLLCTGVLLVGWTFKAAADSEDIHVTAQIPASPVTGPAIIDIPIDGSHFSSVPITVSGRCPADGSGAYIKLYRNDVFSGTAICSASNTFSLQSNLFPEANKLLARIFNKTDGEGPASNTPIVYYDVPNPTPGSPPVTETPAGPFIINTDFHYTGYHVGQNGQWKLVVSGGLPPYAINVDWGDGTDSVVSRKSPGQFTVEHIYKKAGNGSGSSFTIKVSGSDSEGRQAFIQLFVIVHPRDVGPIISTINRLPPTNWLWLAWPAYLVLLLMVLSYWLGEREEVVILRRRGALRRS